MLPPFSPLDLVALAVFAACAIIYPLVVDRIPAVRGNSVMAAMDIHRRRWMRAMVHR
jgi:uncharacterized membrane protein